MTPGFEVFLVVNAFGVVPVKLCGVKSLGFTLEEGPTMNFFGWEVVEQLELNLGFLEGCNDFIDTLLLEVEVLPGGLVGLPLSDLGILQVLLEGGHEFVKISIFDLLANEGARHALFVV